MAKEGREGKRNKREKEEGGGSGTPSGTSGSGSSGRRQPADPTTSYRGSGEFDRESGLARSLETGQMIPRNHFANEDEWAEYFATVPQEIKRAHREKARANQERVYAGLADGMSLADLGVTDEKEHGRALYRRLTAFGLLDPNFEYDWASGTKRNVGTSDLGARNRSERITDSERAEHAEQQRWGGDFAGRINSDAGNRMNQAINNGTFTRDPQTGLLYNDPGNDSSRRQFYDDRGYFIDPTTRQRTGGGHTGHVYGGSGGLGGGNAVFGGGVNSGAWGNGPTVPTSQPKPATPYYRPPTNPWGTPGVTQQGSIGAPQVAWPGSSPSIPPSSRSSNSSFGATSPFSSNPEEQASSSPWRRRRTFGAPV